MPTEPNGHHRFEGLNQRQAFPLAMGLDGRTMIHSAHHAGPDHRNEISQLMRVDEGDGRTREPYLMT